MALEAGPRHNLPVQLTSFVGREAELAETRRLLASTRMLTLTGAGGVGKTRLALETAGRLAPSTDLALVELAPLVNPDLLPRAIAGALDVREQPGEPLVDALTEAIVSRGELLLVLDSCEHLVEACALLVERLLRSCPALRVLATSRERLDVPGEMVHKVAGLSLPAEDEDVLGSEAGRLFLERARLLVPDLAVEAGQPATVAVARICRRLDGIPLAIELAATSARALALEEIAARLDDRFRLLGHAGRTALPRHRTLRAAIDWSHQLLDADEQALFRHVAVFAGGFAVDAAEAVHGPDALPLLARLVDKSLVVFDGARHRMLETIRQYAEEKLVDSGKAATLRDRHRDCFLAVAERALPELVGPRQAEWFDRLEAEHDNLRAALSRCQSDPDGAEAEERLAGALGRFWRHRGYTYEGLQWLAHAVARRPGAVSVARGRALNWAGLMAYNADEQERGTALLEESVAVLRQTTARAELSLALRHLSWYAWSSGDHRRRLQLLEEAMAHARAAADRREMGWGLLALAQDALWQHGDAGEARRLAEQALAHVRGLDPASLPHPLHLLGQVALAEGDPARADEHFQEVLDLARQTGDRLYAAEALGGLSDVARARGDSGEARRRCLEEVAELRAIQARPHLNGALARLAGLELVDGNPRRAARLLGAFDQAWHGATSLGASPVAQYERDLAAVRGRLGDEPFAAAFAEGHALGLDQALKEALAVVAEEPREPTASGSLTPREQEVAGLIAAGRTNRQIAAALVIAEPTAERHVANILNKLGVHSRAQVAAWHARQRAGV